MSSGSGTRSALNHQHLKMAKPKDAQDVDKASSNKSITVSILVYCIEV